MSTSFKSQRRSARMSPTFPPPAPHAPSANPPPPRESKLSVLLFDEDNVCLAELPVLDVEGKLTGRMGDALRVNVPNVGAKDKLKKVELRLPVAMLPRPIEEKAAAQNYFPQVDLIRRLESKEA